MVLKNERKGGGIMTINEALNWMKELKERRTELVSLREENSGKSRRLFGEKEIIKEPVYDVKKIDKIVNIFMNLIRSDY